MSGDALVSFYVLVSLATKIVLIVIQAVCTDLAKIKCVVCSTEGSILNHCM